jgi:hypothetical protein
LPAAQSEAPSFLAPKQKAMTSPIQGNEINRVISEFEIEKIHVIEFRGEIP